MALLTLHRKQHFKVAIPYWVFIDGQPVGMMRSSDVGIDLPEGSYNLAVKIVLGFWKWRFDIGGDTVVTLSDQLPTESEDYRQRTMVGPAVRPRSDFLDSVYVHRTARALECGLSCIVRRLLRNLDNTHIGDQKQIFQVND